MNKLQDLAGLQQEINEATELAIRKLGIECDLVQSNGEVILSANRAALLHLARSIVRLAASGVNGSHFTIDRADIAPDATAALTIALRE